MCGAFLISSTIGAILMKLGRAPTTFTIFTVFARLNKLAHPLMEDRQESTGMTRKFHRGGDIFDDSSQHARSGKRGFQRWVPVYQANRFDVIWVLEQDQSSRCGKITVYCSLFSAEDTGDWHAESCCFPVHRS